LLSVQYITGLNSPTDGDAMTPHAPYDKRSVAIEPTLSAFDHALANLKSQTS
jgi:hypothetical protein